MTWTAIKQKLTCVYFFLTDGYIIKILDSVSSVARFKGTTMKIVAGEMEERNDLA